MCGENGVPTVKPGGAGPERSGRQSGLMVQLPTLILKTLKDNSVNVPE